MPDNFFVSWSRTPSDRLASEVKLWLDDLFQNSEVFLSTDIDKGREWGSELKIGLAGACFGILCITPENLKEPWLLFEAGALYNKFDSTRVAPLLFGLAKSDMSLPLAQLQATSFDENDMLKLARSINAATANPVTDERIDRQAKRLWPVLNERVTAILSANRTPATALAPINLDTIHGLLTRQNEMVQEIYRTVQQREEGMIQANYDRTLARSTGDPKIVEAWVSGAKRYSDNVHTRTRRNASLFNKILGDLDHKFSILESRPDLNMTFDDLEIALKNMEQLNAFSAGDFDDTPEAAAERKSIITTLRYRLQVLMERTPNLENEKRKGST